MFPRGFFFSSWLAGGRIGPVLDGRGHVHGHVAEISERSSVAFEGAGQRVTSEEAEMQWDPFQEEEPSRYDVAQICLNGHIINDRCEFSPECCENYCSKCGEKTTKGCPSCDCLIRGLHSSVIVGRIPLPRFCHKCGNPYPWTSRKLEAAKAYAQDLEALTPDERVQLALSLDQLVKDTPMAQVAAGRFKRLVAKAGGEAPGFFKEVLTHLVSETVKKAIWGPTA
jgi:hypothetical protein